MRIRTTFKAAILVIALLTSFTAFAQKKSKGEKNKFLENKIFNVQFYEMKAAGRGKALPTTIVLKGGKIQCDLMEDKLTLPPINYSVTVDSTYTEDEAELQVVTFEGNFVEEKNEYKWQGTVNNYDIEGTVVQLKGGVEKKKYEFSGSEKTKKKK